MELTAKQVAFIKQDIREKGITMDNLADDLLDHICCFIEKGTITDFDKAYESAVIPLEKTDSKKLRKKPFIY